MSEMRIDILTLFPDTVYAVLHESIIGRAAKKGAVEINCVQIRDYRTRSTTIPTAAAGAA